MTLSDKDKSNAKVLAKAIGTAWWRVGQVIEALNPKGYDEVDLISLSERVIVQVLTDLPEDAFK